MAATTVSQLDWMLKNRGADRIYDQLFEEVLLLKLLEKNTRTAGGRKYEWPLYLQRSNSGRSQAEGADLPSSKEPGGVLANVNLKSFRTRSSITEEAIQRAENNKDAFAESLAFLMDKAKDDARFQLSRQFFSDGSGAIALCDDAVTTTPLSVVAYLWSSPWKYFVNNDVLEITDVSDFAVHTTAGFTLSATPTALSLAFDAGTISGNAATDYVGFYGSMLESVANARYESMGLYGICYDGELIGPSGYQSLYNVSSTTYPQHKGVRKHNSGTNRPLTWELMQEAFDAIEEGNGTPNQIITTRAIRRKYAATLIPDKRYASVNITDGARVIAVAGPNVKGELPVEVDQHCPNNTVFILDLSKLFIVQTGKLKWLDRDGSVLHRVTDKAAWEFTGIWLNELGCTNRGAEGMVRDISES